MARANMRRAPTPRRQNSAL